MVKRGKKNIARFIKKPLKLAAISGIIVIALSLLNSLLFPFISLLGSNVLDFIYNSVYRLASGVFSILFVYGFFILGTKYKNNFLKIISIILAIFAFMSIFTNIFMYPYTSKFASDMQALQALEISDEQRMAMFVEEILPPMIPIIMLWAIIGISYLVLSILFGTGLIKLRNKTKYSKLAGIFEIVGVFTLIILVGFLLLFVAYILELVILFNESKKFKE